MASGSSTACVLCSVWLEETQTVTQVVNAWNHAHPNAQLDTVDELLLQVHFPLAPTAMLAANLLNLAQGGNCEAPCGVHQASLFEPMPMLTDLQVGGLLELREILGAL